MRGINYLVRGLFGTVVISLLVLAAGLAALYLQHGRLLSVQSASMVPVFRPGDALIVTRSAAQPRSGEIISYRDARDPDFIVSHRVIDVDLKKSTLLTAGDVTKSPDKPVRQAQVIGQARAVLPGFGYVLDWLHKPFGLIMAVFIPAIGLIIYEVRRLTKETIGGNYRLYNS